MPNIIAIVLLGLVEGLTEFLPVSSTGHLLLAEHFLPHQSDLFNTLIQSGAVLAVLMLFSSRVRSLLTDFRKPEVADYLAKLAVAFGLTAAGGLILKKLHFKLPETTAPVAWATLLGGILFIAVELALKGRQGRSTVTWPAAVGIGLGQLVAAVFPGASRSGTTILFALILGLGRPAATEFSFLLGIPTLLAAGGVQLLGALKTPGGHEDYGMLALGSIVAAGTAFVVVRWLLRFIQSHTFIVFGVYRIILGAAMLLWAP
jgi:undecaprenyl-diphosphatase